VPSAFRWEEVNVLVNTEVNVLRVLVWLGNKCREWEIQHSACTDVDELLHWKATDQLGEGLKSSHTDKVSRDNGRRCVAFIRSTIFVVCERQSLSSPDKSSAPRWTEPFGEHAM